MNDECYMNEKMNAYALSHIGNSRENHEDNYLLGGQYLSPEQVKTLTLTKKTHTEKMNTFGEFCVAVSDGMGGYECGEIASLLTVSYLSDHYNEFLEQVKNNKENIVDIVRNLNAYICNEARKKTETRNMGATLCGVFVFEDIAYGFNVGDSRLYRYDGYDLKQISVDNTEGQRLLDLGLLTKEEVASFPNKKAIYKYIGKEVELIPDIYELGSISKNELLLLCSDGLSDVIEMEEIQDMLSKKFISTQDKGILLVKMAAERKPDAGDNITVIILEY